MTETVTTLVTAIVGGFNDLGLFPYVGAVFVIGGIGLLVQKLIGAGK